MRRWPGQCPLNKRLDEEAAARANDNAVAAANRQREAGLATLRKQGWNDQGIAEIEKVMAEKGIMDPVDAAIVFEKRHPAPTPTMPKAIVAAATAAAGGGLGLVLRVLVVIAALAVLAATAVAGHSGATAVWSSIING